MPLGLQRLNERSQRPNTHINFIKPLASSSPQDQKIATDFLERIAAQCFPVMKKDYISVMSLEEYPPNPEFLGRNFNAGEVIQLVLTDKAGRWLSFKFVQMVMMHELAHCKQMNHSRYFWQVRNQYADHMKELWAKKYEGEGLWGRGQDLISGGFIHDRTPDSADIPEHLCGGTYRRGRGKKRKRGQDGTDKPKTSYAERQQKRIAKKFGVHGEGKGLGEDEMIRGALEHGGKRHYGKPKVAKSKRGRELRANAALARFEAAKNQQQKSELEYGEDSETESESTDDGYGDGLPIFETLERIKDQHGRDLYKVCGDEGEENDDGGQNELDDLRIMGSDGHGEDKVDVVPPECNHDISKNTERPHEDSETESEPDDDPAPETVGNRSMFDGKHATNSNANAVGDVPIVEDKKRAPPSESESAITPGPRDNDPPAPQSEPNINACPICSLENEPDSPTCIACSHVLKTSLMPNHWRCKSEACKGSKYVNAGDVGRCGLCGSQRPAGTSKPMGLTNADVLRWD